MFIDSNEGKKLRRFLFFAFLVLGIFFRIQGLDKESLWEDELAQVFACQDGIQDLSTRIQLHLSPPLHYLFTWFVLRFEGWLPVSLEALVRSPSVLASIATLVVIFFDLTDHPESESNAPLLTFAAVALSTMLIVHGQEARMYSFLFLFSILSWRYLERRNFTGWTIVNVLGIATHYFFPLLIVAQIVAYRGMFLCKLRQTGNLGLGVQLIALLALTPLFFEQLGLVSSIAAYRYGHAADVRFFPAILSEFFFPFSASTLLGGILITLAIVGASTKRTENRIVLVWALVPLLLSWALSFFANITTTKNLIIVLFPTIALIADGIDVLVKKVPLPRVICLAVLTFALLGLHGYSLYFYKTNIHREDFRAAADYIEAKASEEMVLVEYAPWFGPVYLERRGVDPRRVISFSPVHESEAPQKVVFFDMVKTIKPSVLLLRNLAPSFDREVVNLGRFEPIEAFTGLSMYRRSHDPTSVVKFDTEGILSAQVCRKKETGELFLVTRLCCTKRPESTPPDPLFLKIKMDDTPRFRWKVSPFQGAVPEAYWPTHPFAFVATIPLENMGTPQNKLKVSFLDRYQETVAIKKTYQTCDEMMLSGNEPNETTREPAYAR